MRQTHIKSFGREIEWTGTINTVCNAVEDRPSNRYVCMYVCTRVFNTKIAIIYGVVEKYNNEVNSTKIYINKIYTTVYIY